MRRTRTQDFSSNSNSPQVSTPTNIHDSNGSIRPRYVHSPSQGVDSTLPSRQESGQISPAPTTSTAQSSVWEDWSGRGSHVDFGPDETVPLREGRFLGHGVMGGVYETKVRGQTFAWKRRFCRQAIGQVERKEIEILKKLSHIHIVQLVGTYTHRQFLGLLLYPVAVCDLGTFFEDVESMCATRTLDPAQQERFHRLGLPTEHPECARSAAKYLYTKIGCVVSAVEYLHTQKIRHKDLKPSNILLAEQNMWLTDFGSATDFSLLSTSATENGERGTPKYFAPEVAEYQPSGRAADIFSLGCIFLEICVLFRFGSLKALRSQRPARDRSFQANLDKTDGWFNLLKDWNSGRGRHILTTIQQMLSTSPEFRPDAAELRRQLSHIDQFDRAHGEMSIFGACCRNSYISEMEHDVRIDLLKRQCDMEIDRLKARHMAEMTKIRQDFARLQEQLRGKRLIERDSDELSRVKSSSHHLKASKSQRQKPYLFEISESYSSGYEGDSQMVRKIRVKRKHHPHQRNYSVNSNPS